MNTIYEEVYFHLYWVFSGPYFPRLDWIQRFTVNWYLYTNHMVWNVCIMKHLLLLFNLIFQMKASLLSSWNYSVNGGSCQIPFSTNNYLGNAAVNGYQKPSFLRAMDEWVQAWQKKVSATKSLRRQLKLVQHLSELFFVLNLLLKTYLEKDMILH